MDNNFDVKIKSNDILRSKMQKNKIVINNKIVPELNTFNYLG